jgi:hypothetical protein
MRGYPDYNFPLFDEVAWELRQQGFVVISPAELDREAYGWGVVPPPDLDGFVLEEAMRRDLQQLLSCDGIVLLPGWAASEGVRTELTVAKAAGLAVYTWDGKQPVPFTEAVDDTTGGRKGTKIERYDLLPWDVLNEVARHYGYGAAKYDDHNWRKGYAWSLSYAAMMRHAAAFWNGEDFDVESGSHHLIAVIFHAMALRWFQLHERGTDDRWR